MLQIHGTYVALALGVWVQRLTNIPSIAYCLLSTSSTDMEIVFLLPDILSLAVGELKIRRVRARPSVYICSKMRLLRPIRPQTIQ